MVLPFPSRPQPPRLMAPPMGQATPFPNRLAVAPPPPPGAPPSGMGGPMRPPPPPEPPRPPGPRALQPWQDPKKPKAEKVIETAHRDRDRFAGYAAVVAMIAQRLDLDVSAIFETQADDDDTEPFYSPALKIEHDRFCSWGANHDFTVRAPNTDPLNKEEASMKEDAGYYWIDCWAKQHADAGNGDLQWALFDTLASFGRLATLVTCDFFDDQCGFTFRALDPATTFPFFEGKRGLHHISMVYAATASEILGYYGDPAGKVERKLLREIAKKQADTKLGLDDEGEVVEWIDRAHHVVTWNGVEIKNSRHGYGFVPVRYDRGPWGRQAFTSSATLSNLAARQISVETPNGWTTGYVPDQGYRRGAVGAARIDEAKVGLPFQYWKIKPHQTMEAFMSMNLTSLKRRHLDPAYIITQGYESSRQGVPEIDVSSGKRNTLREDERADLIQYQLDAQQSQLVAGQLVQDQAMGSVGTVAFGMAPPQTTGSAATILDAEGKEIWAPGLRTVQNHASGVLEMCATLHWHWGDLQGAPGSRGTLKIPRHNSRAGSSQAFDLTPAIIERVGVRYQVILNRFNTGTIAPLAAALGQLKAYELIGQEDGIRILGYDPNPQAAIQRMRREQLRNAPAILQAEQLRNLVEEVQIAEARGDWHSADISTAERDYVAFLAWQEEQRKSLMIQSQMLGIQEREMTLGRAEQREMDKQMAKEEEAMMEMQPDPTLPPPRPEPGSAIPAGGTASLPQFGVQVGTQGGRPQGPPPNAVIPPGAY